MAQSAALLQLTIVSCTFELLEDAIFHIASIDHKEVPTLGHFVIIQSCIEQCPQYCSHLSIRKVLGFHLL
jgi:hypothetical protein